MCEHQMHNNAINTDVKKLRCAPLFASGYGERYAQKILKVNYGAY